MKNKMISLLLTMCLVLPMAACGSSKSDETVKPTAEDAVESAGVMDESKSVEENSTSDISSTEITIEKQELYNENDIVITATGFSDDGIFGPEVKLLIENNSDKSITVQTRNSSINGYMVDFQLSSAVAAGKKSNDTLSIMSSDLENSGISTICDMEFYFHIFDSSSWDGIANSGIIHISTSASDSYEQTCDDSGEVLYDNNGIRIISKGLSENDSFLGPALYLYIENNSDQDVTIQSRNTSINGFMVNPILSSEINSGKKRVDTMDFMSSELTDNGIEIIEEIETSFYIFTTENWTDIDDTEPIIISFSE